VISRRLTHLRRHTIASAVVTCSSLLLAGACGAATTTSSASAGVPSIRCLSTSPRRVAAERWSAARQKLAPPGASTIRLCRYSGLNSLPPLTLVGARLLSNGRLVRKLIGEFDRLPPPPPGAYRCPSDDGSQILALLAYPDGHDVTISVRLTGCTGVTNGSVARSAMGVIGTAGPRLVAQLERLVPARPAAASCRSSQLRLMAGQRVSEKTEQRTRLLILRNISASGCDIEGYPRVVLLGSGGAALPFSYRHRGDQMLTNAGPTVVPLAPGFRAYFAINKSPCATSPVGLYAAARIRVTPPRDARALSIAIGRYPLFDYCASPDAGHIIDITPVEPAASAVFAHQ
jgi:hypothetical protein